MKKIFIILIITVAASSYTFGQEFPHSSKLLKNLNHNIYINLQENKQVFRYDDEKIGIQYLPDNSIADDILELHERVKPDVMVEALYKVKSPDNMSGSEILDKVLEISHRVSTISGVKYYSIRKKDYSVLFKDVFAVNNLEEKKRISDGLPDKNFTNDTIYLHMKENAMGNGYYSMNIKKSNSSIDINLNNETALNFLFRVVNPNDMYISLKIFPCTDCIIIYGYCGVTLENIDFVKLVMDPYYGFYRRMTAMVTWLNNSLNGKDELPAVLEPLP